MINVSSFSGLSTITILNVFVGTFSNSLAQSTIEDVPQEVVQTRKLAPRRQVYAARIYAAIY